MKGLFDLLTSTGASTLRSWRGTSASKNAIVPDQVLVLFDREGCPECRFVREAITELNLDVMIAPCPIGGRDIKRLQVDAGSDKLPRLYDPNTEKNIVGRTDIINYLFSEYRGSQAPDALKDSFINNTSSKIASLVRLNAGIHAKPSRQAKVPLRLYSFESSPHSRPVREKLCELELPYHLINLGKQQWADMGMAKYRFSLKPYRPLENTKREAFFKKHGTVQVPFLVDPNTQEELFESQDIVKYLQRTYGG